ncbi:MAG: hypothetical protein QXW94_05725 [Desulfurococcaceae archaeon]
MSYAGSGSCEMMAEFPRRNDETKERDRVRLGVRLLETKYGRRIVVEQGVNRVWLREADLVQLLTVLAREAFTERGREAPEKDEEPA